MPLASCFDATASLIHSSLMFTLSANAIARNYERGRTRRASELVEPPSSEKTSKPARNTYPEFTAAGAESQPVACQLENVPAAHTYHAQSSAAYLPSRPPGWLAVVGSIARRAWSRRSPE